MKKLILWLFFFMISGPVMGQDWDAEKIEGTHRWTFRMMLNGDSLGYSIWEIRKLGDQLLLSEDSHVPNFKEDIFCYVNPNSLQPDSVLVTGRMQGYPIECKSRWEDGRVTGFAQFPKHPSRSVVGISMQWTPDIKLRIMSFVLSPFYKNLEVGTSFSYPQFSSFDGQLKSIEAKVVAWETLEVLGKQVEVLKLELSGGDAEQNIYIDPEKKRIVRITFRDIAWVYELISD